MGRALRPGEEVAWNAHPGLIQKRPARKPKRAAATDTDKPEPAGGKPAAPKRAPLKKS